MRVNIPGPGGSLGECVVCGQSFVTEVLLGQNVVAGRLEGIDAQLPFHKECADKVEEISKGDKDWKKLPDGPLRQEFERADKEFVAAHREER